MYAQQRFGQATEFAQSGGLASLEFFLESSLLALLREALLPSFFKAANLSGEAKSGKPGFADLCCARQAVWKHLDGMFRPLQQVDIRKDLLAALELFLSPLQFHKTFPVAAPEGLAESNEAQAALTALQQWQKGKSRVVGQLGALGVAIYDGEYDADLLVLSSFHEKIATALASPESQESTKKLPLCKAIWDLFKSIELSTAVVDLSSEGSGGGASLSLRKLARASSNPEPDAALAKMKEERTNAWKMASAARKKIVQFCVWKDEKAATEASVSGVLAKLAVEAGTSHRLIVFSADLVQESEKPWSDVCDAKPQAMKAEQRLRVMCLDGRGLQRLGLHFSLV